MPTNHLIYVAWQTFQDHTIRLFSGARFTNILIVLTSISLTTAYIKGFDVGLVFLLFGVVIAFRCFALFYLFHLTYKSRDNPVSREESFYKLSKLYIEEVHKNAPWLLTYYDIYLNPEKEERKE